MENYCTFYLFLEHYDVGNAFNIVIVVVNREAIQSVAFISKHGKVDLEYRPQSRFSQVLITFR